MQYYLTVSTWIIGTSYLFGNSIRTYGFSKLHNSPSEVAFAITDGAPFPAARDIWPIEFRPLQKKFFNKFFAACPLNGSFNGVQLYPYLADVFWLELSFLEDRPTPWGSRHTPRGFQEPSGLTESFLGEAESRESFPWRIGRRRCRRIHGSRRRGDFQRNPRLGMHPYLQHGFRCCWSWNNLQNNVDMSLGSLY